VDLLASAIIIGVLMFAMFQDAVEAPDLLVTLLAAFLWVFIEAALLSSWGTTPGKWLLKVTIQNQAGQKLDFGTALTRSFAVYLKGLGLALPPVSIVTMLVAASKLNRNGITSWDTDCRSVVSHQVIGPLRVLVTVVLFASVFIFVAMEQASQRPGW
jgi:uncharacterized RDD family membrane protein YckC